MYIGPVAPTTYPFLKAEGWHNTAKQPLPPDWDKNDEPPKYVESPEQYAALHAK